VGALNQERRDLDVELVRTLGPAFRWNWQTLAVEPVPKDQP